LLFSDLLVIIDDMNDNQDKKIFVLIPAWNEETKIASVIGNLKTAGYGNILVVNDGSKDNTTAVAKNALSISTSAPLSFNRIFSKLSSCFCFSAWFLFFSSSIFLSLKSLTSFLTTPKASL